LSDNNTDSGDVAEKRVRKPRATADAASAAAKGAASAAPPPAPPAEAAPPPAAPPAASPPAPTQSAHTQSSQQQDAGGDQGGGQEGQDGQRNDRDGRFNNNRRDRFRNRRDRQRERYRDQDGMPQDANGGQEPFIPRPHPGVPEGFPQYSLSDLKRMPAPKLLDIAEQLNISEGVARARKQDVIFALLKVLTRHGEGVAADGVLEILPDGFGFLRAAEASYLAGPDDTYISPSQIRRFNLRTGDHLSGRIRFPKDGERYFALSVVDTINGEPLEASKNKVLFENLTPLFPRRRFTLERGNGSTEDIAGRIST
jgi:transcription termination factor Rho